MPASYQKYMRGLLIAAGGLLLLSGLLSAALSQSDEFSISEECVRCHVATYNQGLKNRQLHPPFWKRRCVACHLAEGSTWFAESTPATAAISGRVVSQENLWRKQQTYSTAGGPVLHQLIDISSLQMGTVYRFRLAVSPQAANAGGASDKSLWLGLRPEEIADLGGTRSFDLNGGLSPAIAKRIKAAALYRKGGTVFIAWETTQPLYGWVELQKLNGLDLAEAAFQAKSHNRPRKNQSSHPPLRDPEDLAIRVCYRCHPQATLGTSHPVRLYGGRDVRIPDDLPTVDGMLTCVTCHNPHGAPGKMLVRETIKTKLCVACHYRFKNSSQSTMF